MKIGIDVSITKINRTGLATYVSNLVESLQRLLGDDELSVFGSNERSREDLALGVPKHGKRFYWEFVWPQVILPIRVLRAKLDLLHMPANSIPMFSPGHTIVTIHDLVPLLFPQYMTFWGRLFSGLAFSWAAKNSTKILTVSEQSKRDIVKHMNVAPHKVVVTYEAASPQFTVTPYSDVLHAKNKYNISTSFILAVGTIEPRKNLRRLFQALANLHQQGFPYQLVHVGALGWFYKPILAEPARLGLEKSVRFLGRVATDDLVRLYNAASLFVFPSLYEGFGLPVLEAMACGCPVITSNSTSLPELVGDAGITVDPYDVQQIAHAIKRVLQDPETSQYLRQKSLQRAQQFSWYRCAHETLTVYRQVLNRQ